MSIEVREIVKRFGSQVAVNHISFTVSSGEIAGFIGPNGAGKSTTMKVLTGTLEPDGGTVAIGGMPVPEKLREIRRIIGYLPENNPLYPEMYIREYLSYVAGLYQLRGNRNRERVEEVIRLTGLSPEVRKKIGSLSKGFRQRVGLAQALIHDPQILILDEPTSGLDPNQLVEIRGLISAIGKEKTILLSTHILQEVEAICDRVIIINGGTIVADERPVQLKERGADVTRTIQVELAAPADPEIWAALPFVMEVKTMDHTLFLLEVREARDVRGDIFNFAVNHGFTILSLSQKERSLEEVFREITRG
jgi:ABC-2 type transport system ATP-binding protein